MYFPQVSRSWRAVWFGVLLAILFIGAFIPGVGKAAGSWHFPLHFVVFMLVGSMSVWALSTFSWFWQYTVVILVPLAHEVCEIWGHHHSLELLDVVIDMLGGLSAVFLVQLYFMRRSRACD